MKPMIFKNERDLIKFIGGLPRPEGTVNLKGVEVNCEECLSECELLVPKMFRYKEILINGPRGIGGKKAFHRYIELAGENSIKPSLDAYNEALEAISEEYQSLVEMGMPEETVNDLAQAKTKIERFKMISKSIEAFRGKVQDQMKRVNSRYAEMVSQLKKDSIKRNPDMKSVYSDVLKEIEEKHNEVCELVKSFDRYCELQIQYNALLNQLM